MTLTIDLPPDVERALEEKARGTGQSVAEFAAAFLVQVARLGDESGSLKRQADIGARLAALGRIGCYDARARAGLPPLTDDAISRESIYEGRGL
jgi:hypothetical protein